MNNEDIYAAAREEYRKVIVAQAEEITRLSNRVEWFTHAVHTCHAECDRPLCKATRENEKLRAENANLLAANRDLKDWWDDLRPDHKRLQAENEQLKRDYETARDAHDRRVNELNAHSVELTALRAENEKLRGAIETTAVVIERIYGNQKLADMIRASAEPVRCAECECSEGQCNWMVEGGEKA